MGERTCYRAVCPVCDAPAMVTDDKCPDCGATIDHSDRT